MKALKIFGLAASFALLFASCDKEGGKDEPDGPDGPDGPLELAQCLKGSDYHVFVMDGITFPKIESKVKSDLRPNDTDMFLHIWDGTLTPGSATGPNFFGET